LAAQWLFQESLLAEVFCKHSRSENSSCRVPEALLAAQECCPVCSGLVLSAADLQAGLACWASSGSSVSVCRCGSYLGMRWLCEQQLSGAGRSRGHRHGPCGGPGGDNAGQASRDALALLQKHCARSGSKGFFA